MLKFSTETKENIIDFNTNLHAYQNVFLESVQIKGRPIHHQYSTKSSLQ